MAENFKKIDSSSSKRKMG